MNQIEKQKFPAKNFIFAGGGTGGHLFPGIALAQYIKKVSPESKILFVGTKRGIETRLVPENNFELALVDITGIKGLSKKKKLMSLIKLPSSIDDSSEILSNFKTDIVIGLGGYASGPLLISAWLNNYPTFIMEQNSVPGITNKVLSGFVNKIFTTFKYSHKYFPKEKIVFTGNPIRESIKNIKKSNDHFKNILIFGGSQGAKRINEIIIEASKDLTNFKIIHQTGKRDIEMVKKKYLELGIKNVEVTSFINDMAKAYENADLVICRAGATSISELQITQKPSILIPFPQATDNHQVLNAKELVKDGAAIMIEEKDLTAQILINTIDTLNIQKLTQMSLNLKNRTVLDSEENILNEIFKFL